MFSVPAQDRGISLEFTTAGPVPETILTDPTRLRQIVANLVGNAIKFTESGGVKIVARLLPNPDEAPVGDRRDRHRHRDFARGAGQDLQPLRAGRQLGDPAFRRDRARADHQPPFCRGPGGRTDGGQRTGPRQHVHRDSGYGAPGRDPLARRSPGPSVLGAVRVAAKELPKLPPARVLIADDGEANRQLITVILTRAGLQVENAENGEMAVRMATSQPFDLVLMDMQMPVMDGYAATTQLRQHGAVDPDRGTHGQCHERRRGEMSRRRLLRLRRQARGYRRVAALPGRAAQGSRRAKPRADHIGRSTTRRRVPRGSGEVRSLRQGATQRNALCPATRPVCHAGSNSRTR